MDGMNQVEPRTADAAERLRLRYPRPRVPRALVLAGVGAAAAAGLGWMVWAGYTYATPQVTAQVATYVVRNDHSVNLTLTVERRDPGILATCRVVAQAVDFETVGEREVAVPAGDKTLVNLDLDVVTLRRATTVVAKGCTSG
jgi:hypothetical protein